VPRQRVPAPYPPEFRAEAIRLVRSGDRKLSEIADDLGVSQQSLRNWVRQADLDDGRRHDGLTTDDRAEVARLRRENRVLREERDILKKAAAFFAGETRSTP
jgi:transposase